MMCRFYINAKNNNFYDIVIILRRNNNEIRMPFIHQLLQHSRC